MYLHKLLLSSDKNVFEVLWFVAGMLPLNELYDARFRTLLRRLWGVGFSGFAVEEFTAIQSDL